MRQVTGDRREKHRNTHLAAEVATAGSKHLMEAMVAACALIAYADGRLSPSERQRVIHIMRALPPFEGVSPEVVAMEFARHEQAFTQEPSIARDNVLRTIEGLMPYPWEVRLLLSACQKVLEADGVYHFKEYQALHDIGQALSAA